MAQVNIFRQIANFLPASRHKNTLPRWRNNILVLPLLLTCSLSFGQINLVKNPSFEQYYACPHTNNEGTYCKYWTGIVDTGWYNIVPIDSFFEASGNDCVPTYCNMCDDTIADPSRDVTLPFCYSGHFNRFPRTGRGLMLVRLFALNNMYCPSYDPYFNSGNVYTYLQGRLFHPLIAGRSYCVSFYVSLPSSYYPYAIGKIGAYLDNGSIDDGTAAGCGWAHSMYTPQILNDSIITDSVNWTKISGAFTATGNESFITLGNFFDSSHLPYIPLALSPVGACRTWYLFDDVSVVATDALANAGIDSYTTLGGDSIWVGDSTGYLECKWYKIRDTTLVLIDSNKAGFKTLPDTTTRYVMELEVCGHTTFDTMTVFIVPTGTKNLNYLNNIMVYPNPATKEINLDGAQNIDINIYDVIGKLLYSTRSFTSRCKIDVSSLNKGVYYVELIDTETGMKVVQRIVKGVGSTQ
jgi:Secretion system C-terminal sorting domain